MENLYNLDLQVDFTKIISNLPK